MCDKLEIKTDGLSAVQCVEESEMSTKMVGTALVKAEPEELSKQLGGTNMWLNKFKFLGIIAIAVFELHKKVL